MRFVFLFVSGALAACSSTSQPEYHPVAVSHVVVAGQQPVIVEAPQQSAVPFEFFEPPK